MVKIDLIGQNKPIFMKINLKEKNKNNNVKIDI